MLCRVQVWLVECRMCRPQSATVSWNALLLDGRSRLLKPWEGLHRLVAVASKGCDGFGVLGPGFRCDTLVGVGPLVLSVLLTARHLQQARACWKASGTSLMCWKEQLPSSPTAHCRKECYNCAVPAAIREPDWQKGGTLTRAICHQHGSSVGCRLTKSH